MKKCYAAACAMVKDEPDLREWVSYHLAVGFEFLLIYDNESRVPVSVVLGDFIAAGFVTVFKVRGRFQQCNVVYVDVLERSRSQVRWMAFLDADEFILPHTTDDIREYLGGMEKFSGIGINRQIFGDSGHVSRPSGLLIENYTLRGATDYEENKNVKSIVNPSDALWPRNLHAFHMRDSELMVNADGCKIPVRSNNGQDFQLSPAVSKIQINHYCNRSDEEFKKTQNMGGGAVAPGDPDEVFTTIREHCNDVADQRILRFRDAMVRKEAEVAGQHREKFPRSIPYGLPPKKAVGVTRAPFVRVANDFRDSFLCILACFNERPYLPAQLEYLDAIGAKVMVVDNMSDDGSWEYLQECGVQGRRIDTKGRYDLNAIQRVREELLHAAAPRWIIYGDVDEYQLFGEPHRFGKLLKKLESENFNALRIPSFNFYNTGEPPAPDNMALQFFYGKERYRNTGELIRTHRYHPKIHYFADTVVFPGIRTFASQEGINCNYGDTKPAAERAEGLLRLRRAWDNGMSRLIGVHNLKGEQHRWRWEKAELKDIRSTQFWPCIVNHYAAFGRSVSEKAEGSGSAILVSGETATSATQDGGENNPVKTFCFDIGGTRIKWARLSRSGVTLDSGSVPSFGRLNQSLPQYLVSIAKPLIGSFESVIICICGDVENGTYVGHLRSAGLAPNFCDEVKTALGVPVFLEWDSTCWGAGLALTFDAEFHGRRALALSFGTGVAGATIDGDGQFSPIDIERLPHPVIEELFSAFCYRGDSRLTIHQMFGVGAVRQMEADGLPVTAIGELLAARWALLIQTLIGHEDPAGWVVLIGGGLVHHLDGAALRARVACPVHITKDAAVPMRGAMHVFGLLDSAMPSGRELSVVTLWRGPWSPVNESLLEWMKSETFPEGTQFVWVAPEGSEAESKLSDSWAKFESQNRDYTCSLTTTGVVPAFGNQVEKHQIVAALYNEALTNVGDSEAVIFIEDDVIPKHGASGALLAALQRQPQAGAIMAAYPRRSNRNEVCALGLNRAYVPWPKGDDCRVLEVEWMGGGLVIYRGNALRQAGELFATGKGTRLSAGWDVNLCRALKKNGYRSFVDLGNRAEHRCL